MIYFGIDRPKRYQLSELVDWFHRIMRKDEKWGYWRYDMRYDPLFKLKVDFLFNISPSFPIANLHWERIERVSLFIKKIEIYSIFLILLGMSYGYRR